MTITNYIVPEDFPLTCEPLTDLELTAMAAFAIDLHPYSQREDKGTVNIFIIENKEGFKENFLPIYRDKDVLFLFDKLKDVADVASLIVTKRSSMCQLYLPEDKRISVKEAHPDHNGYSALATRYAITKVAAKLGDLKDVLGLPADNGWVPYYTTPEKSAIYRTRKRFSRRFTMKDGVKKDYPIVDRDAVWTGTNWLWSDTNIPCNEQKRHWQRR